MPWREDWLDASLNGVPFFWQQADSEGGPANVEHRIATAGVPVVERLGDGLEIFAIEAFVIGEDYMVDRDALIEVLNGGPELELVHPTRGAYTVALRGRWRLREGINDGGWAQFSFTLVKVTEQLFPEIRDAFDEVRQSAAIARGSASAAFVGRFSLGTFATKPIAAINAGAARIRQISGKVQSALNIADSFGDAVDSYQRAAASLMRRPEDLANGLAGVLNAVFFGMVRAPDGITRRTARVATAFAQSISDMFSTEEQGAATVATPEGEREAENASAVEDAYKVSAVIEGAEASIEIPYESTAQVELVRSVFLERFEDLLLDEDTPDELFNSLRDLRAKLLAALGQVAQQLPDLTEYTPPTETPALVIAWELYKDPERDQEVIERNDIRDPGYVPGRVPLEVLNA